MSFRQRSMTSREPLPHVEVMYALLYLPLLIAGTAFMAWYELTRKATEYNHSAVDTVYAIIVDVGYVGVADAGITFGVVEGGVATMVLTRRWLERMERQGRVEGRVEIHRKWEDWNYRRLLAQEEGREFNEPPPNLDDENGDDR